MRISEISLPRKRHPIRQHIGNYSSFLREMILLVHAYTIPDGDNAGSRPLRNVAFADGGSYIEALLQSWAVVGDILTFYQERIANEGYILTALEDDSIWKLLESIGYTRDPGVTSAARLNFTADSAPGVNAVLTVPAGTAVSTIPLPGNLPQIFRASADIDIRGEWNLLTLRPEAPEPAGVLLNPAQGTYSVDVVGGSTGISTGDSILLLPAAIASGRQPVPDSVPTAWFPVVETVTPDTSGNYTTLTWPQQPGSDPSTLGTDFVVVAFDTKATLWGSRAPDWNDLPAQEQLQQGGTLGGGMLLSLPNNSGWTAMDDGLPIPAVGVLPARAFLNSNGSWLAATGAGIFLRSEADSLWTVVPNGPSVADTYCLAQNPTGDRYAGTANGGAFRSVDSGKTWEKLDGTISVSYTPDPSKKGAGTWTTTSTKLPNVTIRTLQWVVIDKQAQLLAGTDIGVFSGSPDTGGWAPFNTSLGATPPAVFELLSTQSGYVFAVTSTGLFRLAANNPAAGWIPAGKGLPSLKGATIPAQWSILECTAGNQLLLVCVTGAGIYSSINSGANSGTSWSPMNQGLPFATSAGTTALPIGVVSFDPQTSTILATTAAGLFTWDVQNSQWAFANTGPVIEAFLASTATSPVPNPAAITDELRAIFSTNSLILSTDAQILTASSTNTWIAVNPSGPAWLVNWDGSDLHASRILPVQNAIPNSGNWLVSTPSLGILETDWPAETLPGQVDLDAAYATIVPSSFALLQQQTPPAATALYTVGANTTQHKSAFMLQGLTSTLTLNSPTPATTTVFTMRNTTVFAQSRTLSLKAEQKSFLGDNSTLKLQAAVMPPGTPRNIVISGKNPRAGVDATSAKPILTVAALNKLPRGTQIFPAAADQPTVTESAVVQAGRNPTPSTLSLTQSLATAFDPSTVTVQMNVVHMTHGDAVTDEVLGDGDAGETYQSFFLKKSPLARIQSPSTGEAQETLQITVNGLPWQRVDSFHQSGPTDTHYMVQHVGIQSRIVFGDGVNGVRLPTGQGNVLASYRVGDPSEGLVNSQNLANLKTRPLGVMAASNAEGSFGAQAAETPAAARQHNFVEMRCLDRIVSLTDFRDYALTQDDVALAVCDLLWIGRSRGVCLTVACSNNESAAVAGLASAVAAFHQSSLPVYVLAAARVDFQMEAVVTTEPGSAANDVAKAVIASLQAAFGYGGTALGTSLPESRIVTVMQQTSGVASVRILHLQRKGSKEAHNSQVPFLPARRATYRPGSGVTAAEALVIGSMSHTVSPGGFTLEAS